MRAPFDAMLAYIRNLFRREKDDPDAALAALFTASSNVEIGDAIRRFPILLDPQAEPAIRQVTRGVSSPAQREHVERLLWILGRCRERGVDAYLAEVEPLADLLESLQKKRAAPPDAVETIVENDPESVAANATFASLLVSAYRGEHYPYDGGEESAIKEAGGDVYLTLLASRLTADHDWAAAARRIENGQRQACRKYILTLASRHPDDKRIARTGFEFIKCRTPNAFALPADDGSIAIGLDPGLQNLLAMLFHAANVTVHNGADGFFIDLISDLVRLNYLQQQVAGLEERILSLDSAAGVFDGHWADWSAATSIRFLIGHEVGHIHLGHLDQHQGRRVRMLPDDETEHEITAFDRRTEFEADAWSAGELMAGARGVSDLVSACAMPAAFMRLMAMIEDLYSPTDPVGVALRSSHPAAGERARRLAEIGGQRFPRGVQLPGNIQRLLTLPDEIETIRASDRFRAAAAKTRASVEASRRTGAAKT